MTNIPFIGNFQCSSSQITDRSIDQWRTIEKKFFEECIIVICSRYELLTSINKYFHYKIFRDRSFTYTPWKGYLLCDIWHFSRWRKKIILHISMNIAGILWNLLCMCVYTCNRHKSNITIFSHVWVLIYSGTRCKSDFFSIGIIIIFIIFSCLFFASFFSTTLSFEIRKKKTKELIYSFSNILHFIKRICTHTHTHIFIRNVKYILNCLW